MAVTSLAMPARRRETTLTRAIYRHHPRFAGTELVYGPENEPVEGGDVLLLAPGVRGGRRRRADDAGRRRAAGPARCSTAGLAHTVLAVPIAQERATMHLDTVCTMVDVDAVVMYPQHRGHPAGYTVTDGGDAARSTGRSRSWWPPPRRWASTRCG